MSVSLTTKASLEAYASGSERVVASAVPWAEWKSPVLCIVLPILRYAFARPGWVSCVDKAATLVPRSDSATPSAGGPVSTVLASEVASGLTSPVLDNSVNFLLRVHAAQIEAFHDRAAL